MRPRQPRTLADWLAALAASGRKVGREHVGPCPLCGGESCKLARRAASE